MRQVRRTAGRSRANKQAEWHQNVVSGVHSRSARSSVPQQRRGVTPQAGGGWELQLQAWQWAQANRTRDGLLPSGKAIARHYGRQERWGRLVKQAGLVGAFTTDHQAA